VRIVLVDDLALRGAVSRPFSGVAPEAMARAMASGRATMATVSPAVRSARNVLRL
jgi:hypothetical protein